MRYFAALAYRYILYYHIDIPYIISKNKLESKKLAAKNIIFVTNAE